ncbi:MAG: hypothetical protein ACLR17_19270 [Enterobacteriaceae bacterium]
MVALHLKPDVLFKSIIVTKTVYGDRVVNHQVDGRKRVHFGGIAAQAFDASRIAARSTTAGTPVKSCIRTRAGR